MPLEIQIGDLLLARVQRGKDPGEDLERHLVIALHRQPETAGAKIWQSQLTAVLADDPDLFGGHGNSVWPMHGEIKTGVEGPTTKNLRMGPTPGEILPG